VIDSKKLKIVFMGTPDFAAFHLEKLIENKFNVVAVYSQPDKPKGRGKKLLPTPCKEIAVKNNIPVFQPLNINKNEDFETLKQLSPDLIITVAYGKILKEKVINLPKLGSWNVHASILPKYRGAAPIQRAIENGEKETGISIFKIVKELDAGPVALIEKFSITEKDNFESIYNKLLNIGTNSLIKFLEEINELKTTEQDHKDSTYAHKIENKDLTVDFNWNSYKIFNKIRAYDPVPGVKVIFKDEIVKIFDAEILENHKEYSGISGEVVDYNKNGIIIKTSDNLLLIKRIQFPGKKVISTLDALNGRKINIGDVFLKYSVEE